MTRILANEITEVDIESITPHPNNPRRGNVELIRDSIQTNGFVNPCLVQRSRSRILAGEHRWRAAREEGFARIPVIFLDLDDDEALRILLVDNKAADEADYDPGSLAEVLALASASTTSLLGTGWSTLEYEALLASASLDTAESFRDLEPPDRDDEADDGDEAGAPDYEALDGHAKGSLLAIADVSIGEPVHEVHNGEVWKLGPHLLVVADIARDWPLWGPLLTGDRLFMPYPGTYLAHTRYAVKHEFVMVQPHHWIAAHILDKWDALNADDVATKVSK